VKAFFWEAKQSWAVDVPAKLSPTGKRQRKLFSTRDDARQFCGNKKDEHNELGRSGVTAEQREWINYAENELGELSILPDVIRHWKRTGPGAIKPTPISEAVEAFKTAQLKRVSDRTKSDIRWRLKAFTEHFKGRHMHQIHAGELETWIDSHDAAWSRRSFYKRLRPLFAYAVRHRWIAEDPVKLLKAPETPSAAKAVYSGKQFNDLLDTADVTDPDYLLPFIVLAGLAFVRTSELVRLYASEDVLTWEDFDWKRDRLHIRETVGKATRRTVGNERWVPLNSYVKNWLHPFIGKATGFVVPDMHKEFAEHMRALHTSAEVKAIHNGLRRSAISHYLAANQDAGIGQLARLAGTSEATIKRHYLESLTPEAGASWFKIGRPALK
jgi:site-specific recombinase XerD